MKSIKNKLTLVFTLVILFLLLGLGILFIDQVKDNITKDTHENLVEMALQEAQYIQARISEHLTYTGALARSGILLDDNISLEEKIEFFEGEAESNGYQAFAFADKEGNASFFNSRHDQTNVGSREYFQRAMAGEANVSDLLISYTSDTLSLYFAVPVYQEGEVAGVFFGRRDGTVLSEIVSEINYKKTGYVYMVNNEGITVAHKDIDLVLTRDNDIENMKTDESLKDLGQLTERMISRQVGSGSYTYHGIKKIIGYAPIENTQWIIAYGLEESEAMEKIDVLSGILLSFMMASCFVGIGVTYMVSSRISETLIKISKEMEGYSNDLPLALPSAYLDRKDEIGVLSRGIDFMGSKISSHISNLEEKNQELLHTRELISKERSFFQTTLHSMGDGVISIDRTGRVQLLNKVAESLTGWTSEEAYGRPFEEVFPLINELSREKSTCPVQKTLENNKINILEANTILLGKDGTETPIEDSAAPILDMEGNLRGVVLVFRDCTEKRKAKADILYLIYHDQLTGIHNRRFFEDALKRLDTEEYWPLSLVMVDVNGLKLTNDAFGHQAGDLLLKIVAKTIKRNCREGDIVSRIGGDEFILLLPQTSFEETGAIIDRLYRQFEQTKLKDVVISVSIGWDTKVSSDQKIMEVYARAEEGMYRRKLIESQSMRNKTIQVILKTLNEANPRERIHSENVSKISRKIGAALNLSQEFLQEIEIAGLLHDIGKIIIDNKVLNKSGKLTQAEYEMVKRHPETGYHILKSADAYTSISDYVLAHHERWDGAGYPRGLEGEEIPLAARIIAVADSYEAMVAERTYRASVSHEEAVRELRRCAGSQFDPEIVQVFCEKVKL